MTELSLQQQLLNELRELKVELVGREGEPQHGRLPRLEASSEDHEKRIARLERAYFVVGVCVGAMGMKLLGPLGAVLFDMVKGR
jgi:hypothetical protein